ncbi:hypothetical protein P4S63_06100 [Pseudoalteromonas sp. B193]
MAFSAGQDFRLLAKNNSIPSPYTIFPGQNISLLPKPEKTKGMKIIRIRVKSL